MALAPLPQPTAGSQEGPGRGKAPGGLPWPQIKHLGQKDSAGRWGGSVWVAPAQLAEFLPCGLGHVSTPVPRVTEVQVGQCFENVSVNREGPLPDLLWGYFALGKKKKKCTEHLCCAEQHARYRRHSSRQDINLTELVWQGGAGAR